MKTISTICMLLLAITAVAQTNFSSAFPVQWKTKIGVTTYRTNMVFRNGSVFIGSNGIHRELRIDSLDGVFKIDGKTGKIQKQYASPLAGDNDVTGIAIDGNRLFCGSDNYDFYCYDITSGAELWKFETEYDVESAPVIADFNGDGKKDVFFSVEQYGFYALNGMDGSVLWKNDSISSHNGNTSGLAVDVNNDGIMDVVTAVRGTPNTNELAGFKMAHYGDYHAAINGKDGTFLWVCETGAGINSSPFLTKIGGTQYIAGLDTYGEFHLIDFNGKSIFANNFGYEHYMSPVISSKGMLCIGSGVIDLNPEVWAEYDYENAEGELVKYYSFDDSVQFFDYMKILENVEGPTTATPVIADVMNRGVCQIIEPTEDGFVSMIDENGKHPKLYKLPAGCEASLLVADIDGDGKLEILVADLQGYLTCYSTNSKGKVDVKGFRN